MISTISSRLAISLEPIGPTLGFTDTDLKTATLHTLSTVLGYLALTALVMILFGVAFNYLGSGQSDVVRERVRNVLQTTVIGLVIVLLAWAIVAYVARTTSNVTT